MEFDFTSVMDRRGMDSIAVEQIPIPGAQVREGFDRIPMWVADMNFPTAPSVTQAISARAAHPAFGYFDLSDAYYDAILFWQKTRNGAAVAREAIGYENGVLGGAASALGVLAAPGDKILVHAPTYIGFTFTLKGSGYQIVHSDLKRDAQGVWRMDYADMDRKIKEHGIHTAIFCSPHNPTGRVWEKWEIEKAMEVYRANDCFVISDEIWSDLLLDGSRHTPTQSVSQDAKMRTVALYAPSKTFNLAGLVGSYHIIYNDYLRDRIRRQSALCAYNHCNVLSMHALIGAYSAQGAQWVDALCGVLSKNAKDAYDFMTENFDGVSLARPQGTYMLYLNCKNWCQKNGRTMDELLRAGVSVGVIWQDGRPFGDPWSIRINLALPHSRVMQAMHRLRQYVFCAQ